MVWMDHERGRTGVTGFTIDANQVRHQTAAAEATGFDVLVEPLTERLVVEGFEADGLPYCEPGELLDPSLFARARRVVSGSSRPCSTRGSGCPGRHPPVRSDEAVDEFSTLVASKSI